VLFVVLNRLRTVEPELFAQLGSPAGLRAFSRPFGSPELDPLILHGDFRRIPIADRSLRRLLVVAYWLRWLVLISLSLFAFALVGAAIGPHAP
jgi:hypothetical protein